MIHKLINNTHTNIHHLVIIINNNSRNFEGNKLTE